MAMILESVHQQRMVLRGVPEKEKWKEGALDLWLTRLPLGSINPQPTPGAPTFHSSRAGCKQSHFRAGTCQMWDYLGTARCKPGAHSSLCQYLPGAGER